MIRRLAILITLLFIFYHSHGQSGLNLPDQQADMAKEKYVILKDGHKSAVSSEIDNSYEALHWILDHAPDLHKSVYVYGARLLKSKIEADPAEVAYIDELMSLYDTRIRTYGDELNVLNRKAYDAFKYLRNDSERIEEIVKLFDYLHQQQNNRFPNNLLLPYFTLVTKQLSLGEIDNLDLIDYYQNLSELVSIKTENGDEDLEKIQQMMDALLVKNISLSCSQLRDILPSGGEPMSPRQSKLIIKLSLAYSCQDQPIFFQAVKVVFEEKPSRKLAKIIGAYHLGNNEFEDAIYYLEQALELSEDNIQKSEVLCDMAKTYSLASDKINARKVAYESLKRNPDQLDCYKLIGDLYFNSFEECKRGKSRIQDRSIFYAAYEMYALAKDRDKMANAEQQFPTMEQIHDENYREDTIINTGCWIQENVKIRRRPKLASR